VFKKINEHTKKTMEIRCKTPVILMLEKSNFGRRLRKIPTANIFKALKMIFLYNAFFEVPFSKSLVNDNAIDTPTMNKKKGKIK
jgi:hypothetical protein